MPALPTQSDATSTVDSVEPTSPVDVSLLSELIREHLKVLDTIAGLKTLVLDPGLAGPLGLVADVSLLKSHGVDRMFYLEDTGPVTQAQKNIVYLCSPRVELMRIVAVALLDYLRQRGQSSYPKIKAVEALSVFFLVFFNALTKFIDWLPRQIRAVPPGKHVYTMLLAPRVTSVCTSTLEEEGVYGSIEVMSFPLELVPLERDVLSLESPDCYRRIFLDGDYGPVYDMAKALITVQRAYGLIPKIVGKGDAAKRLGDTLLRLRKELPMGNGTGLAAGPIESLIIIDRAVDLATPLCNQLTYEGLIDEVVGIRNAHVEVDPAIVNPQQSAMPSPSTTPHIGSQAQKKKKIQLSSADPLFVDLRDRNFAVVGAGLNKVAKRIHNDMEGRRQATTINQIRDFVGRLGALQAEHQALSLHTGLTEEISKTTMTDDFNRVLEIQQNIVAGIDLSLQENSIRDLLNNEAPLLTVLRLLCLFSVVSGGLKLKSYEDFKRDILQTYGYSQLPLLVRLTELGLLVRSISSRSVFAGLRKPLKLIVDDVDEHAPDDIAYVYSGYAPVSVRLVQCALGRASSWRGLDDTLRPLPGQAFELTQQLDAEQLRIRREPPPDQPSVVLVCFLGGITYTEISALRFISQQSKSRKLLVATTDMTKAQNLLESLMPESLRSR